MEIELQEIEPDRYNVIGRLRGSGGAGASCWVPTSTRG